MVWPALLFARGTFQVVLCRSAFRPPRLAFAVATSTLRIFRPPIFVLVTRLVTPSNMARYPE